MALLQRNLILGLVAFLCLAVAPTRAAPSAQSWPNTFKAIIIARDLTVIGDLYYDVGKTQVLFSASTQRLSRAYPVPPDRKIEIYRLQPAVPPEITPTKVPVAEITFTEGGPWLVLMAAAQTAGVTTRIQPQVIDASLNAHPQRTVRIYNFSQDAMAISAGDERFSLTRGQARLVSYPNSTTPALWLKCAVPKVDDWSLEISSAQTIVPGNTRALWLLYDQPGTPENPQSSIAIRNLVEPLPEPEKTDK
ncbi:hypothetical protein [Rariglobus hedericola]|uniref:DUF4397 domain-containing protein n=1 Tax=Rariglobus hedericola TaxID=2597822 RepID=A0A556QP53_9BACT|nr:hypothetical protein [Rariglobus hedericola]TSJ78424.1 hypothetical protein FPL22_03755 [Rariglobus hedericola]